MDKSRLEEILKRLAEIKNIRDGLDKEEASLKDEAKKLLGNMKSYGNDVGTLSKTEYLYIDKKSLPDKYKIEVVKEEVDKEQIEKDKDLLLKIGVIKVKESLRFNIRKK